MAAYKTFNIDITEILLKVALNTITITGADPGGGGGYPVSPPPHNWKKNDFFA